MIVVLVFFAYALGGHKVGGALQTREVNLSGLLVYLGLDSSGLFGLVLLIGVTVVIPFVFFGQLLASSGGANFFEKNARGCHPLPDSCCRTPPTWESEASTANDNTAFGDG